MKPLIGITMGDPAGIGPEIIVKALTHSSLFSRCTPVIFGDYEWLIETQRKIFKSARHVSFRRIPIQAASKSESASGAISVLDFSNVAPRLKRGRPSAIGGRASGEYIEAAIQFCNAGAIDAVVTAPINKQSFALGGWGKKYIGHTEMFTAMTGGRRTALMLAHENFRVVHVTSHIPLKKVAGAITRKRVSSTIQLTHDGLRRLGISSPRIGVCALNPHAGDGGVMGNEEARKILPAIRECRRRGIRSYGPFPADTLWPQLLAGKFDAGVAMYHDQGQIPVKLLGFKKTGDRLLVEGVNVTLGLPIVRTSVAHGTAYDIAGKGIASEKSLLQAVTMAAAMAKKK